MKNGDVPEAASADHHHQAGGLGPVAVDCWQQQLLITGRMIVEILQLVVHWTYISLVATWRLMVPQPERSVAGEVVLVTGAGHGIGRETALQYGRLGASVVCVDINGAGNEETVRRIREEEGRAYGFVCDVTDREAVFSLIPRVQAEVNQPVSILINNAGVMPCRPLLEQTEAEIRRQFDVNVLAHCWLLQATLPAMLAAKRGHVVAVSSVAGMMGFANLVPYCGTKFAVKGMMEALAEELRKTTRDIHFTTVFPYMVDTGLCQKPYIRFPELMPLLRPEEVARSLIEAQRRRRGHVSLPGYLQYSEAVGRLYPVRCGQLLADFLATGVDAVY